jgi:hypothetical protein
MMNRAIFATCILMLSSISSAWAYRVMEQMEDAYELVLGEVILPRGVSSSLIIRPCSDCMTTSLRVNRATTYFVNGATMEFPDFIKAAEAIRDMDGGNQNTAVYVFFDIESRQVNRLMLDHFSGQ